MSIRIAMPSSSPRASRRGDDGRQVHPYHPPVTYDRAQTVPSLFEAVRALARGDDLDTTLSSLSAQACAAGDALSGVVLLHDPTTGLLATADAEPSQLEVDDVIASVLRDRSPMWDASLPAGLPGGKVGADAAAGGARGAIVPLVREDLAGATVEGLLFLVGRVQIDGATTAGELPNIETILAIADLAAVAIRQERLGTTSAEGVAYQERLARTDPLTGLADRTTFGQMLELELARASRLGTALAVAIFDVDDLAGVNEQHGAGVGDDVLRSVAATLADQVRLVDTVARIGPDEFGVIAPGDPGGMVARRVRDAVADLPPIDGIQVSVRAGVSHHPQDGTSSGDLLEAAHAAIAQARAEGAGTVVGLRGMPDLEATPPL